MRVAFDAQLLLSKEKTGIGWNEYYLIEALTKKNRDIDFQINIADLEIKRDVKNLVKMFNNRGCIVNNRGLLPYPFMYGLIRYFRVPYKLVFGNESDLTIFFNYEIPANVGCKTAVYICDVNYKVYPETVHPRVLKWLEKNLEKYCNRADWIITISEFSKQEIVKYLHISQEKIIVIPCGVDTNIYNCNYSKDEVNLILKKYNISREYILYLGTLEPRKNITVLVDAYKKLYDANHDAPSLVIAGKKGWMYKEIFEKVKEYNLERKVLFTGYVPQMDAPKLMAGATLFCFPSLYEGFGMPPLEAMACGTPVIVSDAGSLPEVVADAGVIVKEGDVDELYKEMRRIIENPKFRDMCIARCKNRAKHFTWENAANELEKHLVK